MTVLTRFAPSPTGKIHVGNARTALFCWLFAKANDGRFMLRLDDTDAERSTEAFAQGIIDDLAWLGLEHDVTAKQSERFGEYDAVFEKLKSDGLIYACYETPDELELKRKRQLSRGKPPVYDRAALDLSTEDIAALEAEGRRPHYRFKLSGETVIWEDLVRGTQKIDTASLSDPVLVRADGTYLYTLPSVVDDLEFGVTHVIRGEDHVTNTATQIEIIEALGGDIPVFAHHPLLVMADGSALSKRLGSLSLESLREADTDPMAINSLVARLGTPDPVEVRTSLSELAEGYDLSRLGRAPARFDPDELKRLNTKILHEASFADVSDKLAELGVGGGAEFWEAVKGNIENITDTQALWAIVDGPVTPDIDPEDADYVAQALAVLPAEPWSLETWGEWTGILKEQTGRKGRALFMPLRKALTGQTQGPEMQNLLLLIGAERAKFRLTGA
ncbi:MAG: glutamate--tRNA ligase [Parvibaculales bacterium]